MPCINQGYKIDVMGNVGPPLLFVETGTCTHANSFLKLSGLKIFDVPLKFLFGNIFGGRKTEKKQKGN